MALPGRNIAFGGLLALDTTNTVLRDPARMFDRFEDTTEIARFASAAEDFRPPSSADRLSFQASEAAVGRVAQGAADRLFRRLPKAPSRPAGFRIAARLRSCSTAANASARRLAIRRSVPAGPLQRRWRFRRRRWRTAPGRGSGSARTATGCRGPQPQCQPVGATCRSAQPQQGETA